MAKGGAAQLQRPQVNASAPRNANIPSATPRVTNGMEWLQSQPWASVPWRRTGVDPRITVIAVTARMAVRVARRLRHTVGPSVTGGVGASGD